MKRLHPCHGGDKRLIRSSRLRRIMFSRDERLGFLAQQVLRPFSRLCRVSAIIWMAGMTDTGQAGVWMINGGALRVGAVVSADQLTVGPDGTLTGEGRITCDVLVKGLVSPFGGTGGTISSLSFGGKLEFADSALFVCDASGTPPETDVLNVDGPVYGTCGVVVNLTSGSVPWRNLIVSGGPGSDYAAFSLSAAGSVLCQLQVTGSKLMLTDVLTDSDSDGLPDYWEHDFFGHPTEADPGADPDGDTLSNREECLAGTDPTNPDSCLRWVQITPLEGGGLVLKWDSAAGRFYAITRSQGGLAVFMDFTNGIPASPPQNTITVRTESAGQSFYRVKLE